MEFESFTYNGKEFPDLIRTSSPFYNENLTPTMNDIVLTNNKTGKQFYSHTTYNNLVFNISFAFEGLTLSRIRELKQIFSNKTPAPLVFAERPNQKYIVICSSCSFKYIPFQRGETNIYNGEGEITFESIYPYGIGEKIIKSKTPNTDLTFNYAGDFDTSIDIIVTFENTEIPQDFVIRLNENELCFKGFCSKGITGSAGGVTNPDLRFKIDGNNLIIYGFSKESNTEYKKSGMIYNEFLVEGKPLIIHPGENTITTTLITGDISIEYQPKYI